MYAVVVLLLQFMVRKEMGCSIFIGKAFGQSAKLSDMAVSAVRACSDRQGGIFMKNDAEPVPAAPKKTANKMLTALKETANREWTENGAVTEKSTGSDILDLFATIGAIRNAKDGEIIRRFVRAWAEDHDLAMKLLFYARDIRGGLGERRPPPSRTV